MRKGRLSLRRLSLEDQKEIERLEREYSEFKPLADEAMRQEKERIKRENLKASESETINSL